MIKRDHFRGDELAVAAGFSRQIESSDTYGMNARRQIITFKRTIEYDTRTYIVGWYVPVDLPDDLRDADELWIRSLGQMPLFRVIPTEPQSEDGIAVKLGESSICAAKAVD